MKLGEFSLGQLAEAILGLSVFTYLCLSLYTSVRLESQYIFSKTLSMKEKIKNLSSMIQCQAILPILHFSIYFLRCQKIYPLKPIVQTNHKGYPGKKIGSEIFYKINFIAVLRTIIFEKLAKFSKTAPSAPISDAWHPNSVYFLRHIQN